MGIFQVDQSLGRKRCLAYLEQLQLDLNHPRYEDSVRLVLDKIMEEAENWDLDKTKLRSLLRSMLYSRNVAGAAKVIAGNVPDKRLRPWTKLGAAVGLAGIAWYLRSVL